MRISMLALAGAFALVATAAIADDPMATTYGNTVTTTRRLASGSVPNWVVSPTPLAL